MNIWKHFCTINHHKMLVMKGCFQVGLTIDGNPEPAISKEAQDEIKKILWNERMKAETKKDAERMSH